jgi:enamine deaminase RidA (YjgF/YER057c/UK114 family)
MSGGKSNPKNTVTQMCADIRMRYLGVATPTSTTVGVTRLAGPDFMIEIEAVAVVNS